MGTDPYQNDRPGLITPANSLFSITPGTSELTDYPRALYVGGTGDVVVVDMNGNEVLLKGLVAGVFHPVRCKKVLATATTLGSPAPTTTATDIVGAY